MSGYNENAPYELRVKQAVSFACSMMQGGEYLTTAKRRAAGYYHVRPADVHSGISARSGKSRAGRKQTPRPIRKCWERDCANEATWCLSALIDQGVTDTHKAYVCDSHRDGDAVQCFEVTMEGRSTDFKWTHYKPTKPKPEG